MPTSARLPFLQVPKSHWVKSEGENSLQLPSQDANNSRSTEDNTKKEPETCVGIMGNVTGHIFGTAPMHTRDARIEETPRANVNLPLEHPSSLRPGINPPSVRAGVRAFPATSHNETTKQEPDMHLASVGDAIGHSRAHVPMSCKDVDKEKKALTKDEPVLQYPSPVQPYSNSSLAIANPLESHPLQSHPIPTELVKPEAKEISQETAMEVSPLSSIKSEIASGPAPGSESSHCLQVPPTEASSVKNAYQFRNRSDMSLQNSNGIGITSVKAEDHTNNAADMTYQLSMKDELVHGARAATREPPMDAFQVSDDLPVQAVLQNVEESAEPLTKSPVGRLQQDKSRARLSDSVKLQKVEGIGKAKNRMGRTIGEHRRSERKRPRASSRNEAPSSQIALRAISGADKRPLNDLMQVSSPDGLMEGIESQTAAKQLLQNSRVCQVAKVAETLLSTLCTYAKTSGIDSPRELQERDYSVLVKDAFALYQSVCGAQVGTHRAYSVGVRSQPSPVDDVKGKELMKDNEILPARNPEQESSCVRQGSELPEQVVNVVESFVTAMCECSKSSRSQSRKRLKPQDCAKFVEKAIAVSLSIRGAEIENGTHAPVAKPDDAVEPMEISRPERQDALWPDRAEIRPREAVGSSSCCPHDDVRHVKRIVARMNDIARANEPNALQQMWEISKPLKKTITLLDLDDNPTYFSTANVVQLFLHFGNAAACTGFLVDQADRSVTGGLLKPPVTLLRVVEWGYEVTSRLEEYFDDCWKRPTDALERIKLRDTMLRFRASYRDVRAEGVQSVTQSMKKLNIIAGEARKINLGYQEDWDMMFSDTKRIRARILTMCHRAHEDLYGNKGQE